MKNPLLPLAAPMALILALSITACGNQSKSVSSSQISVASKESVSTSDARLLDGATLVTFGDSLTAMGTWPQDVATQLNMNLVNSGIGGNTSTDGIDRVERDVISKNPDFVIIGFGTNDNVRSGPGKENSQVSLDTFRKNMTDIITKVRAAGAEPMLNTCPFLRGDAYPPASNYEADGGLLACIDQYNTVIREVAAAQKTGLIDMRKECEKYQISEFLVADGVHLSALGNKVYTQMITDYMKSKYRQDAKAPRVTLPVAPAVKDGYWTKSLIVFDPAKWFEFKKGTASAIKNTDGSLSFINSTGGWPEIYYAPEVKDSVTIPVKDSTFNYDFTTDGASVNFMLFFNGSSPTIARESMMISQALHNFDRKIKLSGDDIIAGQTVKGSIPLSELVPAGSIDKNGNINFSGVKLFVVGTAGRPVIVRELSVSRNDPSKQAASTTTSAISSTSKAPVSSGSTVMAASTKLLPTSAKKNLVSMNEGIVDVTYNSNGSLRLARSAKSTLEWPSIAIALNIPVDMANKPILHLKMTPDSGSANGFLYYTDESGSEHTLQFTQMVNGTPNDFAAATDESIDLTASIGKTGKITITKISLSVYGVPGNAVIWNDISLLKGK